MLDNKQIGKNLEKARLKLGLNKAKFATPAGIDTSQYGRAERGEEGLGREKLHLLAEKHGVNPDFLFMGRGPILENEVHRGNDEDDIVKELTPGQILTLLARANEKHAETLAIHARILDRIESKMAQETTQARIDETLKRMDTNLTETLTGVESLAKRQHTAIKDILGELSELKAQKIHPSQGSRKKSHESDGDGEKKGSPPGSGKSNKEKS